MNERDAVQFCAKSRSSADHRWRGPIGMEMAAGHYSHGVKVTVIGRGAKLCPRMIRNSRRSLLQPFKDGGREIGGAQAAEIRGDIGRDRGSKQGRRVFQRVASLGLLCRKRYRALASTWDKQVSQPIKNSLDQVDEPCANHPIRKWSMRLGDRLPGGMQFTHVAGYHGGVVIRSLMFARCLSQGENGAYPLRPTLH